MASPRFSLQHITSEYTKTLQWENKISSRLEIHSGSPTTY